MEVNINNNNEQIVQEKEYLKDSYLFELSKAKLISINSDNDQALFNLIFDKTIFHPQGGGQPSDEGDLIHENGKLELVSLSYDREKDIVYHKVNKEKFHELQIKEGNFFNMKIDENKRRLYARLHSAGHLLDIAVTALNLPLTPGKGYHFPDSPYVEYNGKLDKNDINSLQEKIEKISNELILNTHLDNHSITKIYPYHDGKNLFTIPSYLPEGKPFRWVKLTSEDLGCPCGGTHVKHLKEIEQIKITKLTIKGKVTRISYNLLNKII